MNLKEAREALRLTLTDIAKILEEAGLVCSVNDNLCSVDFDEESIESESVALIYGEISFGEEGDGRRASLECAVSVVEGEIAPEELRRELYDMRAEAKRIAEVKLSLKDGESVFSALEEQIEEEEAEDMPEEDNPKAQTRSGLFKIIGGIAVLAVAVFTLILLIIK